MLEGERKKREEKNLYVKIIKRQLRLQKVFKKLIPSGPVNKTFKITKISLFPTTYQSGFPKNALEQEKYAFSSDY